MSKLAHLILLIALCAICNGHPKVTYEGYTAYRVHHGAESDFMIELESHNILDFWTQPNLGKRTTDVMVAPKYQRGFLELMGMRGMQVQVLIDDVQEIITKQANHEATKADGKMSWTNYHTLDEIYSWLDSLPVAYPGVVEVSTIGRSYEGREIKAVKISKGNNSNSSVFIEGGIHAREWISHATVTYIINELLNGTDPRWTKISNSFAWYIVPVGNPDGYVYSHTTNRLWRKTRTPYGSCFGADPNRNWDFKWGQLGASNNSCSETYSGPSVYSEKEVVAIRRYIESIVHNMDVYLAFHSYSQLFLVPFANTTDHISNYNDTVAIGRVAINALKEKYGTQYTIGNSAEILYYSSGTSRDWIKDKYNVPLTYTIELRDTGRYGFVLPPEQILPNNIEMMNALIALFFEAEKMGYVALQ